MIILRLRRADEKQPRAYPLDAEYDLDELQEMINQAEQSGTEVTVLAHDGSFIEFDPAAYRQPPAVITISAANIDNHGHWS